MMRCTLAVREGSRADLPTTSPAGPESPQLRMRQDEPARSGFGPEADAAINATQRQGLSRPCGRLIQMTVCSSGECRDLCPLPSTSSNKTKLPAGTHLSSPSLVWYSADPSRRTVSTRSGTVCQSTCRAPDGMRVKRMFDAAYFADTSNAAALG